ncbi:hypothetical protein [Amphritea pacifica]|uniref:Bacterial CdiA-CT RNAse A domain-containing protein n=1 Tax=Amphritea pacifica TaxID=2811233 RepID=A0ABS2WDL0_9GAMM|nr:hypothetical protein [Amphritea pacifica]MBN0989607.1 hypothetical protein [Amphritea pacifica]
MLDDARMITAPVVSQRNGELQTSGLERESLLFRTTIERALNRSSFSSGRINPADQPKTAPMSFADSIAVNNKYLLSEDKKAKDKEYVVDLQCVWDNGQSVGEIPIQLSFDNGVVQRYMLPANGHLQVTGVSSLFYKAQLKPDLDNTELSALRTSIQKTLTAIIEKEKAQAAIYQSLQDQMGVVDNVRVHTGAVMWGIWNLAKDSVVAVKEWSDVINPVVAYNNALQAAYVARQAGPESDWSETFRETYNDLQHREWVEALGFDPSKITMAQLAEAYEFANFVYEDPPTQKMLTKFGREYIAAQDSVEFAESVAPTVIVTILGAILTATTLGAGGAVVAGRVAKEFADLGKLLVDLGKALKKAKLSERIFSKMSNKLEKLEIRRPKAQKVAEPKRVDGNRNDGTMRGGSVVPDKKLTAQLDRLRAEGHALERHGGSVTDEQLYVRARTGVAPDGSKTRRGYTPTSTAFNSDELLVQADDFLRNNYLDNAVKNAEPGTLRIKVSADTGVELGRGYVPVGKKTGLSGPLKKVDGLTNVEAWYVYDPAKNIWQTNTIYPIPGK